MGNKYAPWGNGENTCMYLTSMKGEHIKTGLRVPYLVLFMLSSFFDPGFLLVSETQCVLMQPQNKDCVRVRLCGSITGELWPASANCQAITKRLMRYDIEAIRLVEAMRFFSNCRFNCSFVFASFCFFCDIHHLSSNEHERYIEVAR